MYEELQSLLAVRRREAGVLYPSCVVCNGGDAAALRSAVARKIDGASAWRCVFCIDEAGVELVSESYIGTVVVVEGLLKRRAEFASGGVTIIVRPTGNRGHGDTLS